MRNFLRDHWKVIVAIILLVVLAMFTVNPGAATPAPSLAARLRAHVAAIAPDSACDGCGAGSQQPLQAARYIEATLRGQGYAIRRQPSRAGSHAPRNIEVSIANLAPHARPERIFIVGAQVGAPRGRTGLGASRSDEGGGSGGAALLELARLLKALRPTLGTEIRFVFFFDDAPAWPSSRMSGHDFIAFVGPPASSRQVQQALAAFQSGAGMAAHGLAAPAYVQGVTLSTRAGAQGPGAPAIMITGSAFGRYPYFEAAGEPAAGDPAAGEPAADDPDEPAAAPPDEPDYTGIARVVQGLARTLAALAAAQQG